MSAPITVTYDINGGDPQTKNINASTTATIVAQTATPGTYDYNLLSAVYQTGASCPNTFSGKKSNNGSNCDCWHSHWNNSIGWN
jgi:hypothetical protein